jgi:transcriptional regulator with XRE-family HTH domain
MADTLNPHDRISRALLALYSARGIRHQKDMAADLGWDPTRLSKLLNNKARYTIEDLERIASHFDVGVGFLLSDDVFDQGDDGYQLNRRYTEDARPLVVLP